MPRHGLILGLLLTACGGLEGTDYQAESESSSGGASASAAGGAGIGTGGASPATGGAAPVLVTGGTQSGPGGAASVGGATSGGRPVVPATGGAAQGGWPQFDTATGGVATGGASLGGAATGGANSSLQRCDYIAACATEPGSCSIAKAPSGNCIVNIFTCGSRSGYAIAGGPTFACGPGLTTICSEAKDQYQSYTATSCGATGAGGSSSGTGGATSTGGSARASGGSPTGGTSGTTADCSREPSLVGADVCAYSVDPINPTKCQRSLSPSVTTCQYNGTLACSATATEFDVACYVACSACQSSKTTTPAGVAACNAAMAATNTAAGRTGAGCKWAP